MTVTTRNALIEAIHIAYQCHKNGVDKNGQPYLGHPLRVMAEMETEEEMVVAVLHDVFEEQLKTPEGGATPWGYVSMGVLNEKQAKAIDALTRIPQEPYFSYIARLRSDPLARKVKLADLRDNLDGRRGGSLSTSMVERYKQAVDMLTWTVGEQDESALKIGNERC